MAEMKETEKIQITVVNDEEVSIYEMERGKSLFSLLNQGKADFSHCGGNGICGKCRVQFLEGAPLPMAGERRVFSPEELRRGYRLACLSRPVRNCKIELCFLKEKKITVVTDKIQQTLQAEEGHFQHMPEGEICIIAIDLGTTTLAMELRGITTGRIYGQYCQINPQRRYGADVISRIQASNQGERENLQKVIVAALVKGVESLKTEAKRRKLCKPQKAFLAGNTTMGQLLMGYSVKGLGRHPFLPENISKQQIQLADTETVVMPGISAFVGADILAGLYYVKRLLHGFSGEQVTLFIDLGTNGEMAIGDGKRILVTATAAGPAFEGGSGETIMGADMIDCLAQLLQAGILDDTGLLKEPYFEQGVRVDDVTLQEKDVRALQMAKAAVFAGICILIRKFGITMEKIDHVYLAGGFGYYLQAESAVSIGLIPMELKNKVTAVGNTSLGGAYLYGRECMENPQEDELMQVFKCCQNMNLAKEEGFEELYIKAMALRPLNFYEI